MEVYVQVMVYIPSSPLQMKCSFDVCWVPASHPNPCDRLHHCEKRSSVRKQVSQTMMLVFCDEGVFHTVADILSQTHLDIYGMESEPCFQFSPNVTAIVEVTNTLF